MLSNRSLMILALLGVASTAACAPAPLKTSASAASTAQVKQMVYSAPASITTRNELGIYRWHMTLGGPSNAVVIDGADAKGNVKFINAYSVDSANHLHIDSYGAKGSFEMNTKGNAVSDTLRSKAWQASTTAFATDWYRHSQSKPYSLLGNVGAAIGIGVGIAGIGIAAVGCAIAEPCGATVVAGLAVSALGVGGTVASVVGAQQDADAQNAVNAQQAQVNAQQAAQLSATQAQVAALQAQLTPPVQAAAQAVVAQEQAAPEATTTSPFGTLDPNAFPATPAATTTSPFGTLDPNAFGTPAAADPTSTPAGSPGNPGGTIGTPADPNNPFDPLDNSVNSATGSAAVGDPTQGGDPTPTALPSANSGNLDTFGTADATANNGADNSNNNVTADNSGNNATADNSGNNAAADNSGNNATADNSGNNAAADNSGNNATADTGGGDSNATADTGGGDSNASADTGGGDDSGGEFAATNVCRKVLASKTTKVRACVKY